MSVAWIFTPTITGRIVIELRFILRMKIVFLVVLIVLTRNSIRDRLDLPAGGCMWLLEMRAYSKKTEYMRVFGTILG